MTTLKELAAMLDAATGPSRELDARLWWAFADHSEDDHGNTGDPIQILRTMWGGSPSSWTWMPQVTSSIDAALALVERLIPRAQYSFDTFCGPSASVNTLDENGDWSGRVCTAPTAPLAILRALVAALIAQEKTDEA